MIVSRLVNNDPAVLEVARFNADGSAATMCGNALRCSAWAAHRDHGVLLKASRGGQLWQIAQALTGQPITGL